MKNLKILSVAATLGVALAAGVVAPALAWHPEVDITKYVQNQTTGGQMADANDAASAVATKPGDTIKYTIVVKNTAKAADKEWNDLHFTKLTDSLPAGVELVSNPAQRAISEDLGVLKPGASVTKEYILKVTSVKDKDVITNEACVSGDSKVKDAPRKDCDKAVINVSVPVPPVTPEPPKTPQPPVTEILPVTGPAHVLGMAGIAGVLGYTFNLLRLKRRG